MAAHITMQLSSLASCQLLLIAVKEGLQRGPVLVASEKVICREGMSLSARAVCADLCGAAFCAAEQHRVPAGAGVAAAAECHARMQAHAPGAARRQAGRGHADVPEGELALHEKPPP